MKYATLIIISTLIISCNSKKSTNGLISDSDFKYCSDLKYEKAIKNGPSNGKMIDKKNIHNLFEKALIKERYLTEISKKGYSCESRVEKT